MSRDDLPRKNAGWPRRLAKERAGITKAGGIHALRHAFTTHLLEGGADLPTLQRLLGHESVTTTMHYVHLAQHHLTAHGSPLEH